MKSRKCFLLCIAWLASAVLAGCDSSTMGAQPSVLRTPSGDADPNNFATMNVGVGIAGGMFIEVEDTDSVYVSGSRVGYVVTNPGSVLQLDLLQGITLRTYLNGVPRDTASYGALLDLDLLGLSGDSGHTLVSFTATQTFDEIRIGYSAVIGALSSLTVSRACVDPTP